MSSAANFTTEQVVVENNYLSVAEADRKKQLELKRDYLKQELTQEEIQELADINQRDKDRDQAIKDACPPGSKGSEACGVLIGPANEALKKYGENATYSLLYKDLYPEDAKNLEDILQGLDSGSISRDQAITAIAKASGVSWDIAANRYDTAMQLQALTSTLAGFYGTNWISSAAKESSLIDGAGGSSQAKVRIAYEPEGAYINQTSHPSGGSNLCGPTSCAMVISDNKGNVVNLDSVVNQFDNIRPTGVNINEMSSVLSKNGITNQPTDSLLPNQLRDLTAQGTSLIVNVDTGKGGHFIVVDSYQVVNGTGYYMIRDPFNGATGVRADVLEKVMNFNGIILK
ncbi:hypothetical protein C9426_22380 [Serratia sp. S1B]|nr:hypothetical protein C9426_22380 [Serratia sp. S1B]